MNEMKSRALWSDDKTIEDLEFCVYTNGADCVIYSLHEDLVCLKERIAELESERDLAHGWIARAMMKGCCNEDITKDALQKTIAERDIKQQIKGIEDAICLKASFKYEFSLQKIFVKDLDQYINQLRQKAKEVSDGRL